MQKHNYKIIENKENPLESIIEKDGITVQFTLVGMETQAKMVEKKLTEMKAQLELEEASAKNVENNHPEVIDPSEEEIKKAHNIVLHISYKTKAKEIAEEIAKIEQAFVDYKAELDEIKNQTGLSPLVELNTEDLA
jgi:hypothetical protein